MSVFILGLSRAVRVAVVIAASVGAVGAQSQWELVSKTTRDEISIARGSLLRVSQGVVSIWVQHRGADGSLVAERHEIDCATQQRRVLELWSARERPDSAPAALRAVGWLPTEPRTPMRELVDRVCDIRRQVPAR